MGRKDFSSTGDLPLLRMGMIMAFFHICGQSTRWNDLLKMSRSVCSAFSSNAFRENGGMSWGSATQ